MGALLFEAVGMNCFWICAMLKTLANDLYACGKRGLPREIEILDKTFRLRTVLKHDFFAATGLYESVASEGCCGGGGERIVLKINRVQSFLGLPMAWLGRRLCRHEKFILEKLDGISNVPKVLDSFASNGFIYRYIEGQSLDVRPELPEDFFGELMELLGKIHAAGIVYMDMNKRGNILLGNDGHAYMIDFQISQYPGGRWFCPRWLLKRVRRAFEWEDFYHLYKHKRKLQRHLTSAEEFRISKHPSWRIRLHRSYARPLIRARRAFLRKMYEKGLLLLDRGMKYSPEDDPVRFAK
jgi:predicted Ser/Thr protein kinase